MSDILEAFDRAAEAAMLADISLEAPWALIEQFSTLVRESGSQDERTAARYIQEQLKRWGVPHTVHEPELLLSVPRSAQVEVQAEGKTLRAKPPAFSAITGPTGITGRVIYVPNQPAADMGDIFDRTTVYEADVAGKIALTEGMGLPGAVLDLERRGAIGQIHINPGQDIHWSICTTIWGTPDLDNISRKPRTPVVAVNNPDGGWLRDLAQNGALTVTLYTDLWEGWTRCPLIVADIPGTEEPDKFLLAHGHLDSWAVGVGDNAVGDATLLELARVFWKHRDKLRRSIRIAWWPGHSTGRYAGSTWYADAFGIDLAENCIAQVNIDSPGCRWATEYKGVSWMAETDAFCKQAIWDATGKRASGSRPHQAGDYSFNNIGISSFFMLFSSMPDEVRAEKGYYAVGGCGGNIGWHTEHDTLEIADRDNLLRDLKAYVTALNRTINADVYPFDFRAVADEFIATLKAYADAGGGQFDLEPALAEARGLREDLAAFYDRAQTAIAAGDGQLKPTNDTILALARVLVPVNFTRHGRFRNEPAVGIPPLPDLAPINELGTLPPDSDRARLIRNHLMRGRNRVVCALRQARRLVAATG